MKKRFNFWDVIAWVVLVGIVIWLLLKVFGVINTPLFLEYAPYFGAVYLAGWAMHKLENVSYDVNDLKKFRYQTIEEINQIKINMK